MESRKKGNPQHYGTYVHVGMDSRKWLINPLPLVPIHVQESEVLGLFLRGHTEKVPGIRPM